MTETSKTRTEILHDALAEAVRTGNHEMAERTRRLLARQSGETYGEHYQRRWAEQQAMTDDELI